jgi:hypothetical protein
MIGWDQLVWSYTGCKFIMIGRGIAADGPDPDMDGSCFLVKVSDNKYVFIGSEIYEFEHEDNFQEFMARVYCDINIYPYAFRYGGPVYMFHEKLVFPPGAIYTPGDIFKQIQNQTVMRMARPMVVNYIHQN